MDSPREWDRAVGRFVLCYHSSSLMPPEDFPGLSGPKPHGVGCFAATQFKKRNKEKQQTKKSRAPEDDQTHPRHRGASSRIDSGMDESKEEPRRRAGQALWLH